MKFLFTQFLILTLCYTAAYGQCIFPSGSYSWGKTEVDAFILANCPGTPIGSIIIPTDAVITIQNNDAWDLTAYGGLDFIIQGMGSLAFNGSDELILAAGSALIIENTANTNALAESGVGTNIRITIGSQTYTGNDFTAIIDAGGANEGGFLPVDLVYFRGTVMQKGVVQLSWETATEWDNEFFEIEHSSDGNRFFSIGKIPGNGTSTIIQQYVFQHNNPVTGTQYYRLKQVDLDGQSSYSESISITMPSLSKFSLQRNTMQELAFSISEDVRVTVFNIFGQPVAKMNLESGDHQLFLANLDPGQYIVFVEAQYLKSAIKIIR